ncbi:TRAP transporter small permease [Paracoccus sp. S1E-3]|uniref:TRAP transporter small permease n=1 Tax=Paracoccus sp. S1E-3 TaxID=2756130 RepID=UPI0015EFAE92|nr:TRAP transporter small permease subunit [Paracoccus sp. S1E-3]MBA4491646.1 TRAP transporter small permease subunit [Paracoccus sp. S1E-3]
MKLSQELPEVAGPPDLGAPPQAGLLGRLQRLNEGVMRVEMVAVGVLTATVFGLLVLNVTSRAIGRPLIWSDELAINLMILGAFLGTSLGLAQHQHIAVTLLPDVLPLRGRAVLAVMVDLVLLAFFLTLAVLLWRWFDLPGLIRAGSADAYAQASFNFIWQEPMVTLPLRKVWFWMVLPVFCLTGILHVLVSLTARLAGGEEQPA